MEATIRSPFGFGHRGNHGTGCIHFRVGIYQLFNILIMGDTMKIGFTPPIEYDSIKFEYWQATNQLRWFDNGTETVLQQMWQGSNGTQKWENIETVK
jgi:hypothetical protein